MTGSPVSISNAENRLMEVLWQKAPLASEDIVAALSEPTGWHEKAIRTLLNRLLGKAAIGAEKDGPSTFRHQCRLQPVACGRGRGRCRRCC